MKIKVHGVPRETEKLIHGVLVNALRQGGYAVVRESQVEKHFIEQVEKRGGLTRKVRWLCRHGCPDRYAVFPGGRYAFVELKAPGEKLEDHQAREIKKLQAVGVQVVVLDSVEAVDQWVGQFA